MVKLIKELPIPISGLALSLAAMGNLLRPYGEWIRYSLGSLSLLIVAMLIIKIISNPKCLEQGFGNPVVAGVMATFPMTLMILSTYLAPLNTVVAQGVYFLGLGIHVYLIVVFTTKYLFNFDIKNVFPTHFIVYVGIVCASVAAPAHGMQILGQYLFWFGLISYLALLPVVIYRVVKEKVDADPAKPTMAIFLAPPSLCLAGYFSSFATRYTLITNILGVFIIASLVLVLLYMIRIRSIEFYPSYSAFTFPFVISAIATKPLNIWILSPIITFLAIVSVTFVLLSYIRFLANLTSQEVLQN
jgi:exfoliative toxin A/B